MSLTLNAATEQCIQRELDRGSYREPAEVINHALDLLESDQSWSEQEKCDLNERLDRSLAAIGRGEGTSSNKLWELLAHRLILRSR